jgi:hypothetical protein
MTLVELLVVVGLILAVMTMLGLSVASTLDASEQDTAEIEQQALSFVSSDARYVPVIESSQLEIELEPEPVIDGVSVHMQYRAAFDGRYTLRNVGTEAQPLSLRFDFPPGASLVHGVELTVQREGGPALSPPEASYDALGIGWEGVIAPDEPLHVRVRYATTGRDSLAFELPQGTHPTDIDAVLRLPEGSAVRVPGSSLAPTRQEPGLLAWHLTDAISPRSITIELPAGGTAPGRLVLLTELSALGMLLFGAGFWYASEGVRPGRLDDFRLGGLLLLALDYVVFYALFAVVSHAWGPLPGLLCALASLPLLVLHVAGLTDRAFAVRRALPLALATHALLLGLVYLEPLRPWLVLGGSLAVTVILTWTWRSWSRGRELQAELSRQQQEQRSQEQRHQAALERLQREIARQTVAWQGAPQEPAAAELQRLLQRARGLTAPADGEAPLVEERRAEVERVIEALARAGEQLQQAQRESERALGLALEERRQAHRELEEALQQLSLLGTEASELVRDAPPELRQETLAELARLRSVQETASALAGPREVPAPVLSVRQLTRTATALGQRLRERTEQLAAALRVAGDAHGTRLHCASCGAAHAPTGRFCLACGTPRPVELSCGACSTVNRFSAHLMQPGWSRRLHCCGCGAELAVSESLEQGAAA